MASDEAGVEQLQERVKHLEEENRKWMRMAGTGRVTELPNSLMLFQVGLSRELRQDSPRSRSPSLVISGKTSKKTSNCFTVTVPTSRW